MSHPKQNLTDEQAKDVNGGFYKPPLSRNAAFSEQGDEQLPQDVIFGSDLVARPDADPSPVNTMHIHRNRFNKLVKGILAKVR